MLKRKKQELAYYNKRKVELEFKLKYILDDLRLTEELIKIITKETTTNNRSIKC